ncbi:MAG: type II secretion system F family protein [Candidatus Thermoplasmatota archaeon]|nr:type II secretion system F family protein [Candidatus Thermoplasmatota archaeon]
MAKEDRELLYAIWAMEVLVSSGIGLESAIKHVAESDYGKISREFKKALAKPEAMSESLEKALSKLAIETKSKSLKKTIGILTRSLKSETGVGDALRTLAEHETQERKARIQGFIEKLALVSEIFIMILMIPVVIVVISATSLLPIGSAMLDPTKTKLILFAIIFLLAMLMVWAKILETEA